MIVSGEDTVSPHEVPSPGRSGAGARGSIVAWLGSPYCAVAGATPAAARLAEPPAQPATAKTTEATRRADDVQGCRRTRFANDMITFRDVERAASCSQRSPCLALQRAS